MNKDPLISVIVPVYNVELYLERCVRSICGQTYENLEIILIDDGSTDQSGKLCEKLARGDKRILVYHNKKNDGLSSARNIGIHKSSGEYITFVDSDDTIDRDAIEYLLLLLKTYDCNMSLCTHTIIFNRKKRILGNGGDERLTSKQCIERMLYHEIIDTSAWAKLYKKDIFNEIKYPAGKLFEDMAVTYKAFIKSGNIACGYTSKYNYFIRKNSIVTEAFNEKKLDLLDVTDKAIQEIICLFPELQCAALRRQVYARFSTLNQMLDVPGYDSEKRKIIDFILKNRMKILSDKRAPYRDKAGLFFLSMGLPVYRFVWERLYRRGKG